MPVTYNEPRQNWMISGWITVATDSNDRPTNLIEVRLAERDGRRLSQPKTLCQRLPPKPLSPIQSEGGESDPELTRADDAITHSPGGEGPRLTSSLPSTIPAPPHQGLLQMPTAPWNHNRHRQYPSGGVADSSLNPGHQGVTAVQTQTQLPTHFTHFLIKRKTTTVSCQWQLQRTGKAPMTLTANYNADNNGIPMHHHRGQQGTTLGNKDSHHHH